jgi:hypothetical protein
MPGDSAVKDKLIPAQYPKLENQSEEKVVRMGKPAGEIARKILD